MQSNATAEAPLEDDDGNPTALKEKLEVDLCTFETIDQAEVRTNHT